MPSNSQAPTIDLTYRDATDVARFISAGEISAAEAVESSWRGWKRRSRVLNAFAAGARGTGARGGEGGRAPGS